MVDPYRVTNVVGWYRLAREQVRNCGATPRTRDQRKNERHDKVPAALRRPLRCPGRSRVPLTPMRARRR